MKKNTLNRPGKKPVNKSSLIDATRKNKTVRTKNNAPTYASSLYKVLDLFFIAGASRTMSEIKIKEMFDQALAENTLLAVKCIFWARDVREGAGERRFFRVCIDHLRINYFNIYKNINHLIPFYGRWDDLFYSKETAKININLIKRGLLDKDGLLAKWLPRKGYISFLIRKGLRMSPKKYRSTIVRLSNTVEQKMCNRNWKAINYSQVPSVAINKYRKAFYRNDERRFTEFIGDVKKGVKKINAKAIYPHTLVKALYNGEEQKAVEAQWNALPDYMVDSGDNILPVCDTSGSMSMGDTLPLDVSIALGVYISERNKGNFKDAFITFSANPQMHYVKGSLYQRLNQIKRANAGFNTNLQAVFDLILNSAIANNVKLSDMPNKVLIISDMEFDGTGGYQSRLQKEASNKFLTNYEVIKKKYKKSGYTMPTLIFWNVKGRKDNVPGTKDDRIGLVSGFSPSILKSILSGNIYNPTQLMFKTINSERYEKIKI